MPSSVVAAVVGAGISSAVGGALAGTAFGALAGGLMGQAAGALAGGLASAVVGAAFSDSPDSSQQQFTQELRDNLVTVRQPISHWQYIYGRTRVPGALTFAHESADQYFHLVITFAAHECDAIEAIQFNDEVVPLDGSGNATGKYADHVRIKKSLGNEAGQPFPDLVAESEGKWTTGGHTQSGKTKIYVRLKFNVDIFPTGLPNITAVIRGKKVYDPRTGLTAWSENPSLCIANYLCDIPAGLGCVYADEIDEAQLIAAANIDDEAVNLAGGGTEARYTLNGAFLVNAEPRAILGRMLTANAGKARYIGGVWRIHPAAYVAPTITISEDDCRAVPHVSPRLSASDLSNRVKGLYVSEANLWQPTDFPPVTNATYLAEDGNEPSWRELDLPYTKSAATAQRIAKIELEKMRQQISVEWPGKFNCYRLQPGDTVRLNFGMLGWVEKIFEVDQASLAFEGGEDGIRLGSDLVLRETASTVFDWNFGEETVVDPAPDTNLPNPFAVAAPASLTLESGTDQLFLGGDGTVISRIHVAWPLSSDTFVSRIELQFKKTAAANWLPAGTSDAATGEAFITSVEDGANYHVRARFENSLGVRSAWVVSDSHTVIGKTAPPSAVASVTASLGADGVTLNWPEIPDADRGSYAIEVGGIAIATSVTNAKNLGFVAPGSHTWSVRAFDTSRNPAESATPITVEIAAPSAPVVTSAFSGGNAVLSWPAPESSYPIVEYEILRGGSSLGKIKTTTFTVPVDWAGAQDFSVRAIDAGGNIGAAGSVTITPVASSAPSVSGQIIGVKFALAWSAPTGGSLPTARYEIRRGVSFAAGTPVAVVDGLSYRAPVDWLGDATFWVAGIDTAGFPGAAGAEAITISAPAAPLASGGFTYDQAYVEWQVPASTLPLDYYEVRYGSDWSAGVSLGKFYSTRTQFPAQWLGDRNFMVRAYDLNSNPGTIDNVTLTITAAPAPSMTQEVIDNNVLLKWSQVAGTLPTETYELRKGASWDAAAIIGRKSGGFTTVFETVSGNFTYWLAAVDTAGNYGTPGAVTANVNQPPDYVLKVNFNSTFSGTKTNMMQDADGSFITPVNTTESFSDHFTARGWASPQDQITAGYPLYIQPNLSPGGYVETYDYGAVLASNRITVTLTSAAISGTVTPGCTISVSADGSTWTDYADVWSVFATNFRYVKITLAFTAAGTTDLLRVIGLNLRLDSKLKTITKMLPCVAGDAGGTIMYLTDDGTATGNKLFIDVDAIQVTPSGTTPLIAIYDYVDTPYPLSLKALLFTTAGVRASATASITVRGF